MAISTQRKALSEARLITRSTDDGLFKARSPMSRFLPDAFVLPNLDNEFSEYQFSVDNLEEFIGYRIKIVMSGTNEAKAPSFKDLRTIALA